MQTLLTDNTQRCYVDSEYELTAKEYHWDKAN